MIEVFGIIKLLASGYLLIHSYTVYFIHCGITAHLCYISVTSSKNYHLIFVRYIVATINPSNETCIYTIVLTSSAVIVILYVEQNY